MILAKPAWCGLFFEPKISYESGNGKYDAIPSSGRSSRSFTLLGTEVGLLLGAKVSLFWIGIEPTYSTGHLNNSNNTSDSFTSTRVSSLLGLDFKQGLRIWGGAGVYNNQKESYANSNATVSSSSYRFGIGYRWKLMSFNLEYLSETPTKINDSIAGDLDIGVTYSKITMSRWLAGLSIVL